MSLLEVLIAASVLSIAGAGFIQGFTVVAGEAGQARERLQASLLAEDLREEILSKPAADPDHAPVFGHEAGEYGNVRLYLDDRDDYMGLVDKPVTDLKGNPIPGMGRFTRKIGISKVMEDDPEKAAGDKPSRIYLYSVVVETGGREAYRLEWLDAGF